VPVLKRQSEKIDLLAGVPLFAGLTKKELTGLARLVSEVEFLPGDHIVHVGDVGDAAYVIIEGRATVRRSRRKVAELTSGDVVGEMSLITEMPRNAGVRADTFVPALRIDRAQLALIMEEYPKVAVKILDTVASRLIQSIKTY
jgi:CRP-like cAMP-binding protein